MPNVEIEIGEDGKVGTLPEPLQKFFDDQFKEAMKKGQQAEAKRQKEAGGSADPLAIEKLKQLEVEKAAADKKLAEFEEAEAVRQKRYDDALKLREDGYKKDLEAKDQAIASRERALRERLGADVRAAAMKAGARDESLPELEVLLRAHLDLNETLTPFVKGADGQPAVDDKGQPVSIEGFVQEYIASHPHHRKGSPGQGGGANGGLHLNGGQTGPLAEAEAKLTAAESRVAKGDRSPDALNEVFEADKALRALRQG